MVATGEFVKGSATSPTSRRPSEVVSVIGLRLAGSTVLARIGIVIASRLSLCRHEHPKNTASERWPFVAIVGEEPAKPLGFGATTRLI
jgi:hypothetical protein